MKQDIRLKLKDISIEETLERQIVNFGKSSHVILPQKHRGKQAVIIVKGDKQ